MRIQLFRPLNSQLTDLVKRNSQSDKINKNMSFQYKFIKNTYIFLQGSQIYRNVVGAPIEEYRHTLALIQQMLVRNDEPRCPACIKVTYFCLC